MKGTVLQLVGIITIKIILIRGVKNASNIV